MDTFTKKFGLTVQKNTESVNRNVEEKLSDKRLVMGILSSEAAASMCHGFSLMKRHHAIVRGKQTYAKNIQ
jgi:hypothetical protein